jgi:hypothetical protein
MAHAAGILPYYFVFLQQESSASACSYHLYTLTCLMRAFLRLCTSCNGHSTVIMHAHVCINILACSRLSKRSVQSSVVPACSKLLIQHYCCMQHTGDHKSIISLVDHPLLKVNQDPCLRSLFSSFIIVPHGRQLQACLTQ